MNIKLLPYFGLLFLLLGLSTCGGGEDSQLAGGGIGGTGMSIGPISGFGSIFVNGIQYDTTEATIVVNDQHVDETHLQLGMVVRIEGDLAEDSGTAHRIEFNSNVKGPIEQIDTDNNRLSVLGQSIFVDNITQFKGFNALDELNINDHVEVSGLSDADGTIVATWIQTLTLPPPQVEVRGRIQHLDSAMQTFKLGNLLVDFSALRTLEQPIENNMRVEVRGRLISNNQLYADHVRAAPHFSRLNTGNRLSLKGFITQMSTGNQFEVAQQTVRTTGQTRFELGHAADIQTGTEVIIDGRLNDKQILIAERLTFVTASTQRSLSGFIQILAPVEAINAQSIQLLNQPITITAKTLLEDTQLGLRRFRLADLRPGDYVHLSGFLVLETQEIIAETLVRIPPSSLKRSVLLEGPLTQSQIATGQLAILGVPIATSGQTRYRGQQQPPRQAPHHHRPLISFRQPPKPTIGMDKRSFFAELERQPQRRVGVQGDWHGQSISAKTLVIDLNE